MKILRDFNIEKRNRQLKFIVMELLKVTAKHFKSPCSKNNM